MKMDYSQKNITSFNQCPLFATLKNLLTLLSQTSMTTGRCGGTTASHRNAHICVNAFGMQSIWDGVI